MRRFAPHTFQLLNLGLKNLGKSTAHITIISSTFRFRIALADNTRGVLLGRAPQVGEEIGSCFKATRYQDSVLLGLIVRSIRVLVPFELALIEQAELHVAEILASPHRASSPRLPGSTAVSLAACLRGRILATRVTRGGSMGGEGNTRKIAVISTTPFLGRAGRSFLASLVRRSDFGSYRNLNLVSWRIIHRTIICNRT